MTKTFSVALLVAVIVLSYVFSPAESQNLPGDDLPFEFVISLDEPPRTRWRHAMQTMLKKNTWEYSYKPVMGYIHSMIPNGTQVLRNLDPYLTALGDQFGEYAEEMHGIYDVINSTYPGFMTFGELVLMNIFYDVTAGCTSIVGSSTSPRYCASQNDWRFPVGAPPSPAAAAGCASEIDSRLVHGRNLDFPIPGLPNITSVVHFKRGGDIDSPTGEVVLRGVTYLGYVGILTGYRPGGWSVSVDQRNEHLWKNSTNIPVVDSIISFLLGGQSLGTFLRTSLLKVSNYQDAIQTLTTTRLVAPVYLIVGGLRANEGAIITRERDGIDATGGADRGLWSIHKNVDSESWFRAQTNDDNWLPARDDRRATANKAMQSVGSALLNTTTMAHVMRTPPVLNPSSTFTTVMSPVHDEIYTAVVHRHSHVAHKDHFLQPQHFLQRYQPRIV